jgi:hypothetical protein
MFRSVEGNTETEKDFPYHEMCELFLLCVDPLLHTYLVFAVDTHPYIPPGERGDERDVREFPAYPRATQMTKKSVPPIIRERQFNRAPL